MHLSNYYNAAVFTEASAIPYVPALLRGERLLVLAPHPDDEVIGCGGLIAQHLREHRAVRIVIATDGAAGGAAAARGAGARRGIAALGDAGAAFFGFRRRTLRDVAETKYAAIAEHASQVALHDYVGYARGLNAYRTMTLPAGTTFAEAYLVVDLPSLRTTPFSAIVSSRTIETAGEPLPVSVVIR